MTVILIGSLSGGGVVRWCPALFGHLPPCHRNLWIHGQTEEWHGIGWNEWCDASTGWNVLVLLHNCHQVGLMVICEALFWFQRHDSQMMTLAGNVMSFTWNWGQISNMFGCCFDLSLQALEQRVKNVWCSVCPARRCASVQEQLFLRGVISEFRRLGLEEATFQQVREHCTAQHSRNHYTCVRASADSHVKCFHICMNYILL